MGKKLLQKGFIQHHAMVRGFTLIELLIVMAVIGVLAAGVVIAINPQDKVRQANDTKVVTDITQMGRAADTYAAQHNGSYTKTAAELATLGELRVLPVAPTAAGYSAYVYTSLPAACTTAANDCTSVTITGALVSIGNSAVPFARYESTTGKSCKVATTATACP